MWLAGLAKQRAQDKPVREQERQEQSRQIPKQAEQI
jgi:hypothetical protein